MPQSNIEHHSAWSQIGIPIVQWLALSGLLVMFLLIVAGGDHPPQMLKNPEALSSQSGNPFALGALRDRLPPRGIERVMDYIQYYRVNRRRGLEDGLARSTRYLHSFKRIFREASLPEELAYLPLIESGFIEHAVSSANAVGIWQFIEETGRRYDLKVSRWFDQKRDPIHSARAAAKYLAHLYDRFEDWDLALAAYNSGEGTIYWAKRANQKAGLPTDFWSLDLPEETWNYVPAFLGALLIAKNPEAWGFHGIEFMPELVFDQLKVDSGLSLREIARHLGTSHEILLDLNPGLVAGITPPGKHPFLLRVPPSLHELLAAELADPNRDLLLYRVTAKDTLQRLASRFRASPNAILKVNGLDSNEDLKPGRFVIIPL